MDGLGACSPEKLALSIEKWNPEVNF